MLRPLQSAGASSYASLDRRTAEVAVLVVDHAVRTGAAAVVDTVLFEQVLEEFAAAGREVETLPCRSAFNGAPSGRQVRVTYLVIVVLVRVVAVIIRGQVQADVPI